MISNKALLTQVRRALILVADPAKAPQMQAYMKSAMPYHGVPAPLLRKTVNQIFADFEWVSAKKWQTQVLGLWNGAEFREERYAALVLAGHRNARSFQDPSAISLYQELIVSGSWWDYVDELAIHRVGPILKEYPSQIAKKMRLWSKSSDIWMRRTSIICQVGIKDGTDMKLLYDCIEPSIDSKEFFLRKGIGWALRQVAWRNPKEIIRYVKENRERLSPLSKREALKNLLKGGAIKAIP